MQLFPDEKVQIKRVRFRTLGCYPLTGAIESSADDLSSIVLELLQNRVSERQGRAIDTDSTDSMEMKKQEGYF
jgi:sulfate adenylyltransferase subunit 2